MTEKQTTETPGEDTSTEIPAGDPQEIEPDDNSTDQSATEDTGDAKLRREAARYRRSLREAGTERDGLRGRVEAMQKAEVERLVATDLAAPADMWLAGASLPDLLDDDGNVDPGKVNDATAKILIDRPGWRAVPAPPSFDGGARVTVPTATTYQEILRGGKR